MRVVPRLERDPGDPAYLNGADAWLRLPRDRVEVVEDRPGERVILETRAGYRIIATGTGTRWIPPLWGRG